jgi:hypothetical protein
LSRSTVALVAVKQVRLAGLPALLRDSLDFEVQFLAWAYPLLVPLFPFLYLSSSFSPVETGRASVVAAPAITGRRASIPSARSLTTSPSAFPIL